LVDVLIKEYAQCNIKFSGASYLSPLLDWPDGPWCTVNFPFNPLNAELNPICYLLALLEAHNFLHVSRIRVKSL